MSQSDLAAEWTLVASNEGLRAAAERLGQGSGPVGVDAERASGFRYFPNAYLVQAHRRGSGTFLFDPTGITDFGPLADAIGAEEWILHAASQDLPCLRDLGLHPVTLFDTELAGRLLGYDRVGLGALVERMLGIELEKAHSAADWSTRPLPEEWLEYAAFDVSLLPELRDAIYGELEQQEKLEYARQEFEAVRTRPEKAPSEDPWRRLSGGHTLKSRRGLAIARELWTARDELARATDTAPGRILPDASIVVAAAANPRSAEDLAKLRMFRGRASRTELDRWWRAILRGKTTENLPGPKPRDPDAIPHHRSWSQRHPEAAERLTAMREAVALEAERIGMPTENLITTDHVRRLAWKPPKDPTAENVALRLTELGARPWQVALVVPILLPMIVDNH